MTRPFRRSRDGIKVGLSTDERKLLRQLPLLLQQVGGPGADPAANRLNPSAYRDDPEADTEYREMVAGQIEEARTADRTAFAASLDAAVLTDEEGGAWLRVLGETRLVLAARIGIVEDYDWSDEALAAAPDGALLGYLSYLQDGLVGALSGGLR